MVMAPVRLALPAGGRLETYCTPIESAAGPEPDAGLTVSQGELDAAVHVTVFCVPIWATCTVWAGVWNVSPVPELIAPKFSDVLSTSIVGGSSSTTVNVT